MTGRSRFQRVVIAHARRYPQWRPQDIYKLAHQAAMGSGHAVIDREQARALLVEELASLGAAPPGTEDEALIDPISEDGGIVRVHLRPLLAAHLPVEPLLEAFVRTSQEFPGSIEKLMEYLQEALWLKGDDVLPFSVRQITGTFHDRARAGFPAVHHSEEYRNAYHPAYRVTALAFLPPEWTGENG